MQRKRPSGQIEKIDSWFYKGSKLVSYVGGVAVIAVMLIAIVDVILAKLFKSTLPSATEWITYLNILIVFPPMAYVQLERGHTKVDLFEGKIPRIPAKVIRIVFLILSALVMAFLAWRGYEMTIAKFLSGESSSVDAQAKLAFKTWIFGVVFTFGCAACAFSFAWSVIREFVGLSIYEPSAKPEEKGEQQP